MADDIEEISSSDNATQDDKRPLRPAPRPRLKSRSAFETGDGSDSEAMEMKPYHMRKGRRGSWMDDDTADAEIARVFEQDSAGAAGAVAETTDDQLSQSGEKMFSPSHSRNSSLQMAQAEGGGSRPGTATGHVDLSSSMRQRIRQQAKSAVEKKRGAVQLTKRLQRRVSSLRPESTFDARDEETKVSEALQRSHQLSQRARRQPAGRAVQLPSAQEQYDFFTMVYPQPTELQVAPAEPIAPEGADETTLLIPEKSDEPLVRLVRASIVPHHEQLKRENDLYFSPSRLLTSAQGGRIAGDLRRLEEEGLYVGAAMRGTNLSALEQRLLKEPNGSHWFGEDGRLIGIDGDGLASFPLKPDMDDGDELVVYMKAMKGRQANASGIYQLDIDASKMLFTHHPLFNVENILAMRLLQLYRNYLRRAEENLAVYNDQRLGAVKQAVLQFEYLMKTAEEANMEEMKNRLKILKEEVRELRKNRNSEEMMDRKLLSQLVDTWRHLCDVRQAQGFTTTAFQLHFRRKAVDIEQERMRRDADLKAELEEREEAFEEWAQAQGGEQPPQFDRATAWNEIVSVADATRRRPDEPIYIPVLTNDAVITPNDKCPPDEKERRAEVEKHKFILNIYFNDLEVCKTAPRSMNADFCVTFGQIYSLQVYEWPQSIKIIVLEKGVRGDFEQVACLGVPIPSISQVTDSDNALEEIEFSSDRTIAKWKNATGSGELVTFPVNGVQAFIPRTTGVLQCCALWGRDKSGVPLVPPSQAQFDAQLTLQQIDPKNMAAVHELQQLLQKSKFDPNDPVNAQFLSVLKDIEWYGKTATEQETGGSQLECFRLVPEECRLVSDEEFDNDLRFRLLQLRRDQVPEFRGMKMIPAFSNEIDPQLFQRYEKRMERERQSATITGIDSLRAAGNRYATLIRAQVMDRFSKAEKRKIYSDIVTEQPIPTFVGALGSLFGPADISRKLKPFRKAVLRQSVAGKRMSILVNVQSGSNIPVRTTSESRDQATTAPHVAKVEPFVQVWFQGSSARTSVVEGKNPNWQQMLSLDFKAPNNDTSQDSLKAITDVIYLNLYDQVVSKLPSDNRERAHTVHEQVEKRWLGTIEVPFATLYWNGKIEGALRVRTPPVYLGYTLGTQSEVVVHPYIKLLIATEPPLSRPETLSGTEFESVETDQVVTQCRRWNKRLVEKVNPARRFISMVTDTHGRTVLVNRFLRPIKPPPDVEAAYQQSPRKGADLACRIVALIPFVSDPLMFPGVCDVWSTCDEFLRMLCGDEEEHCVLLWCWLAGLGINCSLLLGNGLPEGPRAAYVLANFVDGSRMLYNASDGQAYEIHDAFCPLLSVGTMVVADNVYGNVQQHEHPSHMRFEVEKTDDWLALFSRTSPSVAVEPVQPHTLEYVATDPMSVVELRGNLEREIKHRFDEWRVHGIPQWNFHAAKTLRDLLPLMEDKSLTDETHAEKLKTLTESYKMCGVPLHMPYEQVENVIEAVKATNVHVNFNRDVEFALAVYIHPYTNNILSCWIYIASLIRLR